MAVKSMKLKLKTNSGNDSLALRKGLWKTHLLINQGIAFYLNGLTLLRQEAIGRKTKEEVRLELIFRIKEQQKRNGYQSTAENIPEEVFTALRQLYECIVPSATGESGDAQILSRKYLSPLVDPDSKGGEGESKAGRKPGWLLKKEAGDPSWEQDYQKAMKRKEADPTPAIMQTLRKYGLKPLFPLFTNEQADIEWLPVKSNQFVRTWDRDMFQQAIERLLSWESWNRRIQSERAKLEESEAEFHAKHLQDAEEWLHAIQDFERNRTFEHDPIDDYRITSRQIRGWKQLYAKWDKLADAPEEEYISKIAEVQASMPREFGDPVVFRFLAKPENHHIWKGHQERLFLLASYNQIKRKLSKAKQQAEFTLPDAVRHPLWVRFDARDGNLHDYELHYDKSKGKSGYSITFSSLIMDTPNGWKEQRNVTVELAASRQFRQQVRIQDNAKGRQQIVFTDYSCRQIQTTGDLGGGKIQFDRRHLENHSESLAYGNVGPVFFNLVVNVEPIQEVKNGRLHSPLGQALKLVSKEWPKVIEYKPAELEAWMKQTRKTTEKGEKALAAGMRVMSVDMGIRTSAAVSIYELQEAPPDDPDKPYFKLPHNDLYAVHSRSLLLNMPGEKPEKHARQERHIRDTRRYLLRSYIRMLGNLWRLYGKDTVEERRKAIEAMLVTTQEKKHVPDEERAFWKNEWDRLLQVVDVEHQQWQAAVEAAYRRLERLVGQLISEWRKSFGKGRKGIAGLSMWSIDELEGLRKLLISWSKRSRRPGEKRRIEENEKFAVHVLKRIQEVKENRLKQMSNLIVMTALGYKYKDNKWVPAYPACQLVLFENLSRYRFTQDRSRKENSQLMKWAHRSIPRQVWMQGEPFGLQVGDVSSEFSSRFHARTGAPGIRCHAVTKEDIEGGFLPELLVNKKFLTEEQLSCLKPGDIVPMQGGELFVTLAWPFSRKLVTVHADINAAQNLQRRFWNQNSEIYRIVCQAATVNGVDAFLPKYKTAVKHLGKGYLTKLPTASDQHVYKWENAGKIKGKKPVPDDSPDAEEWEDYLEGLEEAQEIKGEYKTMFRDPSGFLFAKDTWRPQVEFWSIVKNKLESLLRQRIVGRGTQEVKRPDVAYSRTDVE